MLKRSDLQFKPPEEGEVRRSGWASVSNGRGYTVIVDSCSICAGILGVPWMPRLFEGQCRGCEVQLSGSVA